MSTADGPGCELSVDSLATQAPSTRASAGLIPSGETILSDRATATTPAAPSGVGLEEFERGLVGSGLMDREALGAFRRALPPGPSPDDAASLARALVREGKLTRYQASALYQGKARSLAIGPYCVLDKLGSGGMGLVFKAVKRGGGPEVALKLLPPSASKEVQAVQRFRREAAIMARLDHPNVVAARELGEYGGVHYLIMDYVEGRDLDKVVRSGGPLKVGRAVDAMIQAARGLHAAHERGIVHRDIKPANLLLDTKGVVRVLDLGLARVTHADDPLGNSSGPGPTGASLTRSGVIMGTVDFLPPEQSDDSKRADHRADIYSLGCTLHYLLTGRPPFLGDSILRRLIAHHQDPPPSLRESRADVPAGLDDLFARMMAKAPEDRPASMVEVIEAMERCRVATVPTRGLRVFDDGQGPGPRPPAPVPREPGPPAADPSDLLTFVRSELLAVDEERSVESIPVVSPIPPRKSGSGARKMAAGVAIGVMALGLAGLGVVVGFLASMAFVATSKPAPSRAEVAPRPKAPAAEVEPPRAVVPAKPEATPSPGGPGLPDLLKALARPPGPPFPPPPPLLRPGGPGFGPPGGPIDRPRYRGARG